MEATQAELHDDTVYGDQFTATCSWRNTSSVVQRVQCSNYRT